MNNRNVILTGAGAVIPWGAPTTDELTDILRHDSVFINDKGEPIGEYIYSLLLIQKEKRRGYHNPNFETILHFVELLFEHKRSQSFMSDSFFKLIDFFLIEPKIQDALQIFETKNANFYSLTNDNKAKYLDKDLPVFEVFMNNKPQLQKHFDVFFPELLEYSKIVNSRF